MKKLLIIFSMLITTVYLSSAIDIVLNSGTKLDNSSWTDLSSVLNKVDVSGSDININGKLAVDGKICYADNNCMGECSGSEVWDVTTSSCLVPHTTPETAGTSCMDILTKNSSAPNRTYYIDPDGKGVGNDPFEVYCNMTDNGGGWMLVFRALPDNNSISYQNNTDYQLDKVSDNTKAYKNGKAFDVNFTKMLIISHGQDTLTSLYNSDVNTTLLNWVKNSNTATYISGTKIVGTWKYLSQNASLYTGVTSNKIHGYKLQPGCGVYPATTRIGFTSYNGACSSGYAPGGAWGFGVDAYNSGGASPYSNYKSRYPASPTSNEYAEFFIK